MDPLSTLARAFLQTNPESAAHVLETLDEADAARALESMPPERVGAVIEQMTPRTAGAIFEHLGAGYLRQVLEAVTPRQAALALQQIEPEKRQSVLAAVTEAKARELRDLLRYSVETAGGMMEPQVTSIASDLTAEEAIAILRRAPRKTLYYLYVTDRHDRLVGVLQMRDLLLAPPEARIQSMLANQVVTVPVTMDREDVATLMRQRGFLALPVVDDEGRLLGVVKHEQALHTVQQEAFEDLQKLVGAGGDERAVSPISEVVKKRLPWLCVNLLTAFAAASVVGLFESTIARVSALAVLMPIVSGQGGNSGAQTLAVVIRGLALREIMPGAVKRLLLKEVIAAGLNGLAISLIAGGAVYVWSRNRGMALVIAMAMFVNMTMAGLAGAAIPLLLRAVGRDPAQSSSIFLTTVTDVVGFASFLGLATLLLPLLR